MTTDKKMKISLVSPVYNESEHIVDFVRRSVATLQNICSDFEIILVNDCSTDTTGKKLAMLAEEISQLKLVTLSINAGQHGATVMGLKIAKGDYTFLMDSDLQVAPEEMASVFNKWRETSHWDIISGVRAERSSKMIRKLGSRMMSFCINMIADTDLKDPGSTFMLIKKKALDEICEYEIQAQNLQILMGMLNLKIMEYPVESCSSGKSSYRFSDLTELFILAFLNFTTGRKTLFFLSATGGFLTISGFFGTVFLIIKGIINSSALPTNLLIFFTFLFVIGAQFLLLGIIAFKLERININLEFRKSLNSRKEKEK